MKTIPAEVRIEPEAINLKSKGEFTAFIDIPSGYDVKDWDAIVCEGAPAIKGTFSKNGQSYVAKFNRQDLINITEGEDVSLTVTAIFEYKGEKVALEGTYPVRIIK